MLGSASLRGMIAVADQPELGFAPLRTPAFSRRGPFLLIQGVIGLTKVKLLLLLKMREGRPKADKRLHRKGDPRDEER